MDTSMLSPDSPILQLEFIRRLFREINTCIPGEVVSFDKDKQTASIKPCLKDVILEGSGERKFRELPAIWNCPVVYPLSTSGFSLTFPLKQGDQVLILFSQRSFDNWLAYGSVREPAEPGIPRTHDYTDAICLPGLLPNVNALSDFQTDGIELRNNQRTSFVKVSETRIEAQSNSNITMRLNAFGATLTTKNATLTLRNDGTVTLSAADVKVQGNVTIDSAASGVICGTSVATVVGGIVTAIK